MQKINILWADDEIDLLKPHVLFLEEKGYKVETATNGEDALDLIRSNPFDIVLLDENMPGLSGLETLSKIKNIRNDLPVVMITKSEEEYIMDEAIGSKISDYLIKPVHPKQILLSLKKNLETRRLVSEKTTSDYQREFREIGITIGDNLDHEGWCDVYKKMVYWELELENSGDSGMDEIIQMQKSEANNLFSRFIDSKYLSWLQGNTDAKPMMSHTIFKKWVLPTVESEPTFFVLIDNLRYDQWKVIEPVIKQYYKVRDERTYFSILPTATQYARNAIFAGLLPSEIAKKYPEYWRNDSDEGSKNQFENELLSEQLKRYGLDIKTSYHKITNLDAGKRLADNITNLANNDLNVIVYNFVDMLSHARTEMEVIRELADDEKAYRSLTLSWFKNSPLIQMLESIAALGAKLVITTDHGTIRCKEPSKVIGDRNTNTNLRYKQGRNLQFNPKEVLVVSNPDEGYLPKVNVSTSYIFAKEDKFFAYPNNYNHYVKYYRNTFQHGGISLEEMIIPFITLDPR